MKYLQRMVPSHYGSCQDNIHALKRDILDTPLRWDPGQPSSRPHSNQSLKYHMDIP